jgi:hypothetical protein
MMQEIRNIFLYILTVLMELTELRKRMEHDIDEVSNIAKNIKDKLEALDREVSYV